jgi:hypothetical protein
MSLLGRRHTPAYAATIGQAVDFVVVPPPRAHARIPAGSGGERACLLRVNADRLPTIAPAEVELK